MGCSDVLFTCDTEFKIWKQVTCDVCMNVRVLTGDVVVCVSSDQTAGFVCMMKCISEWKNTCSPACLTLPCLHLMDLKYFLVSNKQGGRKRVVVDLFSIGQQWYHIHCRCARLKCKFSFLIAFEFISHSLAEFLGMNHVVCICSAEINIHWGKERREVISYYLWK